MSAIKISELIGPRRIDAECYREEFLQLDFGEGFYQLSDLCLIQSGTTPPDRDNELREGVVLLKTTDVRNSILSRWDSESFYYISPEIANRMKATRLQSEDVLINIVGATTDVIGRAAYVPHDFPEANITQAMALLRVIDKRLNPAFLFSFLAGEYGNKQVRRYARPTGQFNLNLQELGSFKVPLPPREIQLKIEKLVRNAHVKLDESKILYTQAQALLAAKLGLDKLDLSESLYSVRRVSEVRESGRADAEYYREKYYRVMNFINQCEKHEALGKLIEPIRNGFDYREFVEEGTPYIRVGDVRNGRIDLEGSVKIPIVSADVQKDVGLQIGDTLFTRKGTYGNVAVVRQGQEQAIISSEIMLLRLRKNLDWPILPDYLALFLNSSLGYQQVERRVHGVAYYSISQPDLAEVQIVIPPVSLQKRLAEKVQLSLAAEQDAKRLLAEAKAHVERMIEGQAHNGD